MPKLLDLPDEFILGRRTFGFFEDFEEFVTGDLFTDTSADSGAAVTNADGAGGIATLTTGATDNNECNLLSTRELFLFAADKPAQCEARIKHVEANTDDANVAFGWCNAVGADTLVDDGAGLKASFSGACIYKVDGGTRWQCISSVGTTRTTTDLTAANSLDKVVHTATTGTWFVFRIEFLPITSTLAEVSFWIDGVCVAKHDLTFTSATEMNVFVGNKAGGANSEVHLVDYIASYQLR